MTQMAPAGSLAVVRGSLAPDGGVIKTAAATPALLTHRGPAVVFSGYRDMLARIDDLELPVSADSVLVLRGCGPQRRARMGDGSRSPGSLPSRA